MQDDPECPSRRHVGKGAARLLAWMVFLGLLALYLALAIRHSSNLGTLSFLPRGTLSFLDTRMTYRNLWAFALLGLYAGLFLGVRAVPALRWPSVLLTAAFLLAPSAKELLQTAFPPRDGNLWGASLGTVGMIAGLGVGQLTLRAFRARKTPQPQSTPT